MKYLSVCSGIEAATVAWHPLNWTPVGFSEIEKFPSNVLAHHYPDVPNYGDMTDHERWPETDIDVLVGGTPCQSFSVAGLRKGMADPRGNLALIYLAIADQYRPNWLVWENVPGVLSSDGGRDFGSIVGGMVELGYSPCWRVLDAQYFGVPQRRRRVFVIASSRGWQDSAKVLFEPESLLRNPAPSRKPRQGSTDDVTHSLRGRGFDASEDGTGRGTPLIPDVVGALSDGAHCGGGLNGQDAYTGRVFPVIPAVAFRENQRAEVSEHPIADALLSGGGKPGNGYPAIRQDMAVRRLTPMECERLQGFPDNYTNIPGASDSGRYKALGNSMAVPVMHWIGRRINDVR